MQNQIAPVTTPDSITDQLSNLVGISRLVPLDVGCAMIGCTPSGMKRFIREHRVPEGLVVYIGRDKKLNLEILQQIVRGEARILSAHEAHERGFFHSRVVRAQYERRHAKERVRSASSQPQAHFAHAE
jgi:hypothetical protein